MTKTFLRTAWWQQILIINTISICYILLAGIIGTEVLIPKLGWGTGNSVEKSVATDSIAGRFARWDSGYYLHIAQYSYSSGDTELAFFPLYPIAIRLLSTVSGLSYVWGGFLTTLLFVGCVPACSYINGYKSIINMMWPSGLSCGFVFFQWRFFSFLSIQSRCSFCCALQVFFLPGEVSSLLVVSRSLWQVQLVLVLFYWLFPSL